jgi:hypothetical protein
MKAARPLLLSDDAGVIERVPTRREGDVMRYSATTWIGALILLLGAAGTGCGDTEGGAGGGGTAGTGGSGGTRGGEVEKIALPKCAVNGYSDLQDLWSRVENILRYMHHTQALDPSISQRKAELPDLADLPPIEDLDDNTKAKPRVLWSTFEWTREQTGSHPERFIQIHVYQGLDEDIYGREGEPDSRNFSIKDGIYQGDVAILNWLIDPELDPDFDPDVDPDLDPDVVKAGAGTFSVNGQGPVTIPPNPTYYSARATIIRFPECLVPDEPTQALALCSDPEVPDTSNDNPWFEVPKCRFELTSFGLHLNLSAPLAEPTAVLISFTATVADTTLESGSITLGTDGTAEFSATHNGQPVTFSVDFERGELILRYTGEPEQVCVYDTVSGEIGDCTPSS